MPSFALPIADEDVRPLLAGLFATVLELQVAECWRFVQASDGYAGLIPSDERWLKIREQVHRDAFQRVVSRFPEPLRSRFAAMEQDIMASIMGLN
jgi:hypothetical protein